MTSLATATPKLQLGPITLEVPVVLAPMAGITNTAFRRLCREFGAGLYVSEMITSRALVERGEKTMRLIRHHESETPRSIQLYGVDPKTVSEAVTMLVAEDRADHIDLNFGCPVPKVTRKGGGAALPWKIGLFREIVESAVKAAGDLPLTIKMRKGIDNDHLTYLEAGRVAQGAGVASIALHARTASEYYSGQADWSAIARLKEAITDVPILGNGDIWSGADAIRMVEETGCDGVVVGRGCLGRPWLFGDLVAAFEVRAGELRAGAESDASRPRRLSRASADEAALRRYPTIQPTLGVVAATLRRHTVLLAEFLSSEPGDGEGGDGAGSSAEHWACRDIRKHVSWYFKGYPVGSELRSALATVESLQQMDDLLGQLDWSAPYPGEDAEGPRGRAGHPKRTALPEGWLDSHELATAHRGQLTEGEADTTGG